MLDQYTLGISSSHNSSICLLKNGEIILHLEEERYSRIKIDDFPIFCFSEINKFKKFADIGAVGFNTHPNKDAEVEQYTFFKLIQKSLLRRNSFFYWENYEDKHHTMHAACSFYNSGFEDAVCVVIDGQGSINDSLGETESIITASYPNNFNLLYKKGLIHADISPEIKIQNDFTDYSVDISFGHIFEKLCIEFGFEWHEAGKIMGLAAYGKENKNIPKIIIDGRGNPEMFKPYFGDDGSTNFKFIYEYEKNFQNKADIAYAVQKECQEYVKDFILKAVKISGKKNICLSGGFFLNCVANYDYLKYLPKDTNLYIEPISSDAGLSIGIAKYLWHQQTQDKTIRKQSSIYYGPKRELCIPEKTKKQKITAKEVAKLLYDGKIVSMFQGRSESGPRALGNRSILFNPTIKNGKDIINSVKKRESFRPFAGTIIAEKVHEWFDMRGLKDSPFMMFAVNCLEEKKMLIPSIVHEDGTCRIQTITKEQNLYFYNLILEFYNLSDVPILFNTSFNLAGEPLVETLEDALYTFKNSKIDFLYLPEEQYLITK